MFVEFSYFAASCLNMYLSFSLSTKEQQKFHQKCKKKYKDIKIYSHSCFYVLTAKRKFIFLFYIQLFNCLSAYKHHHHPINATTKFTQATERERVVTTTTIIKLFLLRFLFCNIIKYPQGILACSSLHFTFPLSFLFLSISFLL